MRISGQYRQTTHIEDAGPSAVQLDTSRKLRALYVLLEGANRSVEIPDSALHNALNFFKDVADVLPRFADQNSYAFEYQKQHYQLTCEAGLCTLLQSVPKESSLGEEMLQALAATVTLGLASCSTEPIPYQWQPVAQFQDADATTDSVSQSEPPPEAGDQTADIQDIQPRSQVCIDSDGGNKPFAAGFVVTDPNTSQKKTHVDVCKDSTYLYEQTCVGDQHKQIIVKCADILPGGACVQDGTGGKCAIPPAPIDAGSTDTGVVTPDAMSGLDTGPDIPPTPDVPPVDYLKQNPLPLALDDGPGWGSPTSKYGMSNCLNGNWPIAPSQLSQCLYLKALYTIDGVPIVAANYSDLVAKIKMGPTFFLAVVEGDKQYPKTAAGKPIAFQHSTKLLSNNILVATYNNPEIAADAGQITLQFYDKANPLNENGCYVTYLAPNGFANCVK